MSHPSYKKPPITEAIVEFRGKSIFDKKLRKKWIKKFSKRYDQYQPKIEKEFDIELRSTDEIKTSSTDIDVDTFSSNDATERLLIRENKFGLSQLAEYPGWEVFESRIRSDLKDWKEVVGFTQIAQVGMRYINRIDIPLTNDLARHSDYVTVYPRLPTSISTTTGHAVKVSIPLDEISANLILNVAKVDSPLPHHLAVLLDLDIIKVYETPPSDELLMEDLGRLRTKKNELFEMFVTDKARMIFNQ